MIDLDDATLTADVINFLITNNSEVLHSVDSPSGGKHIITTKFNRKKFNEAFPGVDILKDGTEIVGKGGYTFIKTKVHPNRDQRNYVRKHVKVMSDFIKRPIKKGEVIHHIDMDKANNNINNLYLCKGVKEHQLCHTSIYSIIKPLLNKKVIKFEKGKYLLS